MNKNPRAIRDITKLTRMAVYFSGMVAGIADSLLLQAARESGWIHFSKEFLYGSLVTSAMGPRTWWIGFGIHLGLSAWVASLYALLAKSARRTGVGFGLHVSLFHWIASSVLLGLLPIVHPLISERFPAPGFFALGEGLPAASSFLLAHLLFGAIVGALFHRTTLVRGEEATFAHTY